MLLKVQVTEFERVRMKIRRFYSHNLRSALKQVTDEFGVDAAILSNKKVAGGVEVVAAIDYDESLMPSVSKNKTDDSASADSRPTNETAEARQGVVRSSGSDKDIATNRSLKMNSAETQTTEQEKISSQLLSTLKSDKPVMNGGHTQSRQVSDEGPVEEQSDRGSLLANGKIEWSLDPSLQAMKEELGLMRSMMSEQLKGMAWSHFSEQDPMTATILRRLSELGLDKDILNSLLPHIKQQSDVECAWQQALALVTKSIPVTDSGLLTKGGVFALMGPTGVGKTTTIAKLAARFVIKHGADSVALITTDSYRIGAQEQLATYGRILQVPTARTSENQSLSALIKKYADKKLILIDTAGMSIEDSQLTRTLTELTTASVKVNKLLLMSASSQGAVLRQSLNLFSAYQPDGIIVTKLDEAACLGELLSVVIKSHIPVEYTTDGQRVPEDIRQARNHHLLAKAVWLANKYANQSDEWTLAQSLTTPSSDKLQNQVKSA